MTVQHIELAGQRYVILPEHEFKKMLRDDDQRQDSTSAGSDQPAAAVHQEASFPEITPLKVQDPPASEMLIRDRR